MVVSAAGFICSRICGALVSKGIGVCGVYDFAQASRLRSLMAWS